MDKNGTFDLSQLDKSLELNLSFDPEYTVENLESKDDNKQLNLLEMAVRHYLKHNITLDCLEDVLKLMNMARDNQTVLPTTKYLIFQKMSERSLYDLQRKYHVRCSKCNIYSKGTSTKQGQKCKECGKLLVAQETNFFIYMSIENQLAQSIKSNWSLIQRYNAILDDKVVTNLTDAHSANLLKKIQKSFSKSDQNPISLTLNTDGANKFKSNKFSVWPIQIIQNFLPPEVRFKPMNVLTIGLYYGERKPNCMKYFEPFVHELKILADRGITLTIDKETYVFVPFVTHCVVDLPAKRMLQCIKQYNGRNACTYCTHPGCDVNISIKKKVIRYTNIPYAPRTDIETLKGMNKKSFDSANRDGIMGISCLVSLPKFKIITGFGIDYMHCVDLGVVRKLLNFFVNSKYHKKPFYLNKEKLALLDQKLLSIKPISEISRKPRSIKNRCDYKANEFRSILLYYFPVCLINVLPSEYVEHFQLLSSAIYILSKSSISRDDLFEAEQKLKIFVREYENLYGKIEMVMNVHLLTHIVESVRNLGPLWTQSAFPFERNNGILLKLINGSTDVLDQISSKYLLKKYLQETIKEQRSDETVKFIGKPIALQNVSMTVYEDCSDKSVEIENKILNVYRGIKINGIKYTSRLYKELKKSIDYFIGLKSGSIGISKYYISHENKAFVLFEKYEVIGSVGHILDVKTENVIMYAPVDTICTKYIYMNLNGKDYIACMPNNFENE